MRSQSAPARNLLVGPAAFLAFITGPAGALRGFAETSYFYTARFVFIGAGLFLAFVASTSRRDKHCIAIGLPLSLIAYGAVFAASTLVNAESLGASALQVLGVVLWAVFGCLIALASNDRNEALAVITKAYIWAHLVYAALAAWLLVSRPAQQFHSINGRWLGPFTGSTEAAEVMFAVAALGFIGLSRGYLLSSTFVIGLSIVGTFATGVRSSSAVLLGAIALFMIQSARGGLSRRGAWVRLAAAPALGLMTYYLLTRSEDLMERFSRETFSAEGRVGIWRFGVETLSHGSTLFGIGTRAVLAQGVSSEGIVYNQAIAWHNTWLALGVETGVAGFLAHVAILAPGMAYCARALKRWALYPRAPHAAMTLVGSLIGLRYVLISVTEMNLYTALSSGVMLFGSLFGVIGVRRGRDPVIHRPPTVDTCGVGAEHLSSDRASDNRVRSPLGYGR